MYIFSNIELFRMEITPFYAEKKECIFCDFHCCKMSDWDRHVLTAKHQYRTKLNILEHKKRDTLVYSCKTCQKTYKVRNSL